MFWTEFLVPIVKITDYGKLVLNAIYLNDTGDSEGSNACWQEVLKRNSNCEMAYVGLGKTFLSEGDYKKAMEYFKLGNSRKYYSKAFYYYRKEVMEKNFGKIMAVIILLVLALVAKINVSLSPLINCSTSSEFTFDISHSLLGVNES